MNIALIFPGQGSQYVGMGLDFYDKSEISKSIFQALNEITDRNLTDLIFFGSEEELSITTNSQPAIMATSISIYNFLNGAGIFNNHSISYVAGHSLGEYSALVANKSITFEDAVKLLVIRSKAMQDSVPIGEGGMAAIIGQEEDEINSIIKDMENIGKLFIANDNAHGQIVVSGEMKAIDYLSRNAKNMGIKRVLKLSVSAPFHCELIENASLVFESALENFHFNDFKIPFYSNVTAELADESEIKSLLSKQIVSKVRWRETMINMINSKNVDIFIEIGPGKVLANLIKRTTKDIKSISVGNLQDLDKLKDILK